jgi:CRP-like cAMP-binding protein
MGSLAGMGRSARRDRAWIDRMRSIWLLSDCTVSEIRRIRSLCTPLDVPEGRTLVRQGETGSQFFINERGTAVVSLDRRPVALIEAGSFFGDTALFGRGSHRATVTAATPMELLVFSHREASTLVSMPIPSVRDKIDAVLTGRREALAGRIERREPELRSLRSP